MEIDKHALLAEVRARVAADLAAVSSSQRETQAGATHDEAKPESDKDTRAIEASYLARGLAERVASLRTAAAKLQRLQVRAFDEDEDDAIALTALVGLADGDDEDDLVRYFVLPAGAGIKLDHAGEVIRVVTPESPVGQALLGRRCDDEVTVPARGGARSKVIVSLS
ncbi:MAG: elongation factor GreAB [Haliangiales bacterium]